MSASRLCLRPVLSHQAPRKQPIASALPCSSSKQVALACGQWPLRGRAWSASHQATWKSGYRYLTDTVTQRKAWRHSTPLGLRSMPVNEKQFLWTNTAKLYFTVAQWAGAGRVLVASSGNCCRLHPLPLSLSYTVKVAGPRKSNNIRHASKFRIPLSIGKEPNKTIKLTYNMKKSLVHHVTSKNFSQLNKRQKTEWKRNRHLLTAAYCSNAGGGALSNPFYYFPRTII